jgi:hypothetical protein
MSSERVSRRATLKGLATGLGAVLPVGGAAATKDPEDTWGHTIAFGDQYYQGELAILEAIRRTEMERIGEIAERMAATLRRGGKVWMQAKQGHMGRYEFDPANAGNPGILESNSEWDDTDYERMRPGDVLVTNYVNQNVRSAREAGVFVVGVPVPYHDSPGSPRGFTKPNPNGWFLSDVSSLVLESHIPYAQGIVDCPEVPEMKLCPSSASPLCALFWMLQAEVADKLRREGTSSAPRAEAVLDTLIQRTKQAFASQRDRIFATCPEAAHRIGRGGHYHVTSEHGGVAREATGVASGPMMTNAFRDKMQAGDLHLLASIEPDAPKILEEARKARGLGMHVIAIGPGSSNELRGLADVFIDNLSPEGGGLLEIPGFPRKVATLGGVINNVLMWIFTAQLVDEMVRRGLVPWFWMGFFQVGGKEYDDAVRPFFLRQGF